MQRRPLVVVLALELVQQQEAAVAPQAVAPVVHPLLGEQQVSVLVCVRERQRGVAVAPCRLYASVWLTSLRVRAVLSRRRPC